MTREEAWQKVVTATEGHHIHSISVTQDLESSKSWTYIECTCYPSSETMDAWEYPDHIRRLVFAALYPVPDDS